MSNRLRATPPSELGFEGRSPSRIACGGDGERGAVVPHTMQEEGVEGRAAAPAPPRAVGAAEIGCESRRLIFI